MIFNLQMFAEGEGTGDAQGDNVINNGDKNVSDVGDAKQDNSADDVQAKIDAAVTAQLAKVQAKWEQEFKKREEQAKKEAQRLSKLSDDERQKAELEAARVELENQKMAFAAEKIKYEATKVLAQRNLPVEFVEYLVDVDNESTLARITTFEKNYKKAIENGVNEKLKGKAPSSSGKTIETPSNASFMKAIYDSQINV